MARTPPQNPLIAVIGATGTGKSQLAVELARRFKGEVINADAMQLYHGLPIITNKITHEEMKGIPHHLLGSIGFDQDTWTVVEYVKKAMTVIDEIRGRGRLPILVGGTNYYIRSLLFRESLIEEIDASGTEDGSDGESKEFPILDESTEVLVAKLRELDPVMADRWHPRDRRKIRRSLQICLRTGRPASQMYEEQHARRQTSNAVNEDQAASASGPSDLVRFPALLFWVHAAQDVLRARLDSRVDKMLEKGLLEEVEELHEFQNQRENIDLTRGIWVSIGYKELLPYLRARGAGLASEDWLEKSKAKAIEQIKAGTRQYAKRQIKFIRIQLLNALKDTRLSNNMFVLDGTDVSQFADNVERPALDIAEQFLNGDTLPDAMALSEAAKEMLTPKRDYVLSERRDLWVKRECEMCNVIVVGDEDWKKHVKGRMHRIKEKKRKKAGARPHRQDTDGSTRRDSGPPQDVLEFKLSDDW
ncbi:tRNA isopentenyltransferase-like protein [Phyllosticta citricarpa]|uniref:tRNA dimethylallyltransferase n=2 Tax=Phyllosticta TaxID=121621 RepID=A0ABR1LVI6_9PEZI